MSERVLPTPEKFASCPYEGKILEFYEGQFESVYMLLHPFFKPISIDSELFYPDTWPTKNEIIEGCEIVKWQDVLQLTSLETLSEIDIGLRTNILGLKESKCNHVYGDILKKLTEEKDIIQPPEGDLPPLLENRIYSALLKIGYEWLWVGDEFGTERKLNSIDDLIEKDEIPPHGCVFTHDHNILVATHWDSHCSFLCSSKKTIEKILEFDDFEGFYCTPKTEVYWGLYEI